MVGACTSQDALGTDDALSRGILPNNHPIVDDLGTSTTWSTAGSVDLSNDFFQELGINGRTCGTCHKPSDGWTVSASDVRKVFDRTDGLDPLFRPNDGTNSPDADVSTLEARRAAYSMMLSRGTIRVGIGVSSAADFELIAVDDPYGHASAAELSLFRRPLPSANLTLIPVVMWDGRVTGATITEALGNQANGATQGHAQAPDPIPQDVRDVIVAFETGLYNAQLVAKDAGRVDTEGAFGGAEALADQARVADRFDLFDAWKNSDNEARRAVYRGQELFNTKPRSTGAGTCRTCHSAQNSGTNVAGAYFNIGVANGALRTPDLPLYTFRSKVTGQVVESTDPGRALITNQFRDIGKFKVPSLRALGARAPYFHNGSAQTLLDVVRFYEASALAFRFTEAEEADLVAFLSAL